MTRKFTYNNYEIEYECVIDFAFVFVQKNVRRRVFENVENDTYNFVIRSLFN